MDGVVNAALAAILEDDTRRDNALMNTRKRLREATETIERLATENRALRVIVQKQARILDRSEPARVGCVRAEGSPS